MAIQQQEFKNDSKLAPTLAEIPSSDPARISTGELFRYLDSLASTASLKNLVMAKGGIDKFVKDLSEQDSRIGPSQVNAIKAYLYEGPDSSEAKYHLASSLTPIPEGYREAAKANNNIDLLSPKERAMFKFMPPKDILILSRTAKTEIERKVAAKIYRMVADNLPLLSPDGREVAKEVSGTVFAGLTREELLSICKQEINNIPDEVKNLPGFGGLIRGKEVEEVPKYYADCAAQELLDRKKAGTQASNQAALAKLRANNKPDSPLASLVTPHAQAS